MYPSSSYYCSDHDCEEFGFTAACGDATFCSGKLSGWYCDGSYLKQCTTGSSTQVTIDCMQAGCSEDPASSDAACGSANFCTGKIDGDWCDGGAAIKRCPGNTMVSLCQGSDGCWSNNFGDATCGTGNFCLAKLDGSHCDGAYLKTCVSGAETSLQFCGTCSSFGVASAECGSSNFCTSKTTGSYCDGSVLKSCASGSVSSQQYCQGGCQELTGVGNAGCGGSYSDSAFVDSTLALGSSSAALTVMLIALISMSSANVLFLG